MQMDYILNPDNIEYRRLHLMRMAIERQEHGRITEMSLSTVPKDSNGIKCSGCKRELARDDHVISHDPGMFLSNK
jgi:hypothetical protein